MNEFLLLCRGFIKNVNIEKIIINTEVYIVCIKRDLSDLTPFFTQKILILMYPIKEIIKTKSKNNINFGVYLFLLLKVLI